MANINDITEQLAKTKVNNELLEENDSELSFAGRGLKLDSEESAFQVIQSINECKSLKVLRLDGNTIGVEAAKGIAKALEKHSEFQRALWSDIFTGRFKTEIPQALRFLSLGITMANAHLVELDLSDNAFGPAGVEAVTELLKSPSGFSLQNLRFNNNGLGSGGGKILSKALLDCHKACNEAGIKFALKMFIAGRNRLENPGAKALAQAFKVIGTLEEVVMPQNGIYHEGISALADAFAANKNLKILNLNDNTFTQVGAKAMAKALSFMQNLEVINFGDCLMRTEGAVALASALKQGQPHLKELHLNNNEIGKEGALAIAESLSNKNSMLKLEVDGNQFGEEGIEKLRNLLNSLEMEEILGSLSDDEGEEDEEDDEDDDDDNTDEEEEEEEEEDENKENTDSNVPQKITPHIDSEKELTTVSEFLSAPSASKLLHLGSDRAKIIITEMRDDIHDYDKVMEITMKLACLLVDDNEVVNKAVYECIDAVLSLVFKFPNVNLSLISNHILVYLGLIKSEEKVQIPNNLAGPLIALQHVVAQSYFPKYSREILQVFLSRPIKVLDPYMQQRNHLLQALFQA